MRNFTSSRCCQRGMIMIDHKIGIPHHEIKSGRINSLRIKWNHRKLFAPSYERFILNIKYCTKTHIPKNQLFEGNDKGAGDISTTPVEICDQGASVELCRNGGVKAIFIYQAIGKNNICEHAKQ